MSNQDKIKANKIAEEYAKQQGKTLKEVIEPITSALNSDNENTRQLGVLNAKKVVEDLTTLMLRQEIFANKTSSYMTNFLSYFDDGMVNEGNGKLYDFNNATGVDTWNKNSFIPTAFTTTDVDEFSIVMYGANGTLSDQGYQFKKPQVYSEKNWIPYFRAGNLSGFIAQLHSLIEHSWNLFIYDKLIRKITDTNKKPAKQITGTATNAFDCWATEILPAIREMTTDSVDFNYNSASKVLMSTSPEDLIVVASAKTIQTLQSGIKSQLFNAKFLDIKGLVDTENFFNPGKKLTIGDNSTRITNTTENYINDNTVIVLSKKSIKHFKQVQNVGVQGFADNMSTLIVKHVWGAMDWLPWGQAFIYTNNNLNTLP